MVKLTRSLTTGSFKMSSVDTIPVDVTPVIDVPKEMTQPPTAQAPTEESLAKPKVPEFVVDDTQSGNNDLFFHTAMMSVNLIGTVTMACEPLDVNPISVALTLDFQKLVLL